MRCARILSSTVVTLSRCGPGPGELHLLRGHLFSDAFSITLLYSLRNKFIDYHIIIAYSNGGTDNSVR